MPWKMDDKGNLAVNTSGNPIWIKSDNSETAVEGSTIPNLNAEAKANRERAEAAEEKLRKFGNLDPDKARDAVEKLTKIDQKTLIDAGEVDKVTAALKAEHEKEKAASDARFNKLLLDNAFNSSKFIADRVAVPADLLRSKFEAEFIVKDEKVVPKDATLFSKKNPGTVPAFDEALELILDRYEGKDRILKGNNNGGSGSGGAGGGAGAGNKRTLSRAEFGNLKPYEQAAFIDKVKSNEAALVD